MADTKETSLKTIKEWRVGLQDTSRPVTWAQLTAAKMVYYILTAAAVIILLSFAYLLIATSSLEEVQRIAHESGNAPPDYNAILQTHQQLNTIIWERFEKGLQYLVGTIALPLITLLLGYAFGRQGK